MLNYKSYRRRKIKEKVIERDGAFCCYCEVPLAPSDITMDHLIPDCNGGGWTMTNLTVSCSFCNGSRRDQPFWKFIEHFNFSSAKIEKYQHLLHNYAQIKILRLAIEQCGKNDFHIPQQLIERACHSLGSPTSDFTSYIEKTSITSLQEFQKRKKIIAAFETIIQLIEREKL